MIDLQIERLNNEDRRLLEVASVTAAEFSAASVAAGLGTEDIDALEQACGELARRGQFRPPGAAKACGRTARLLRVMVLSTRFIRAFFTIG